MKQRKGAKKAIVAGILTSRKSRFYVA